MLPVTTSPASPGSPPEPVAPSGPTKAEVMSRDPLNEGALVFKRTGDPSLGNFSDAEILKTFGLVPDHFDDL